MKKKLLIKDVIIVLDTRRKGSFTGRRVTVGRNINMFVWKIVTVNLTIVFNSLSDICFDLPPVQYTQTKQTYMADPVYFRILGEYVQHKEVYCNNANG